MVDEGSDFKDEDLNDFEDAIIDLDEELKDFDLGILDWSCYLRVVWVFPVLVVKPKVQIQNLKS